MNEVTKLGGLISGVAILVDRSNGTINLHKNQYSIVELEVVSYDADSVPNNLKEIPVQKPGSRKTQ
jgi:orotate phosphoribosyltransferase